MWAGLAGERLPSGFRRSHNQEADVGTTGWIFKVPFVVVFEKKGTSLVKGFADDRRMFVQKLERGVTLEFS